MRCWAFQLIPFIPRQQLISQWREIVCMAKSIKEKGTPNHILVNKILDYPISEFRDYCNIVLAEMVRRGYNVSSKSIEKLEDYVDFSADSEKQYSQPFKDWHDGTYVNICMWNLYEKFLCGGVTKAEWAKLCDGYKKITGKDFVP